eukprot:1947136-Amphidinium_carterae.1
MLFGSWCCSGANLLAPRLPSDIAYILQSFAYILQPASCGIDAGIVSKKKSLSLLATTPVQLRGGGERS